MKNLIKEMGYICSPSNLSIKAEHKLLERKGSGGAGIELSIYDNGQFLFSQNYITKISYTSRYQYDEIVKDILTHMFSQTRKDFIKYILKDKIKGTYFYDNLKVVRSKLGTIIFKRKSKIR